MRASIEEGVVETLPGTYAPPGARPIELVFRTVGERTSDLALQLALQHVKPTRAHVIRDVKPFALAVRKMLEIEHHCDHVVHMDADCLILEDMRPFLDANTLPYVDCYVRDRFRGRIHCGVHVTRIDVVDKMRSIPEPLDDLAYVLRPESRLRNMALADLALEKQLKSFHILHDHFQRFTDIFAKYALRELRSRTEFQKKRLGASMARWGEGTDYDVARRAVQHAASTVPEDAKAKHVELYIRNLPYIAEVEVRNMGLEQSGQVTMEEVEAAVNGDPTKLGPAPKKPKVFGLGLSRTGTRSLTAALHVLGFDTVHYPTDRATLDTLVRGDARFPLLDHYDGMTDITTAPYFEDFDRLYPGSKFVLTVRDTPAWLQSCRNHWTGRSAYEAASTSDPIAAEEHRVHMEIRRFLRAAVYASYEFDEARFERAHRRHVENVTRYFANRPNDLLVLDIAGGDGFEKLAPFLGVPVPEQPFPHKGKRLSERMAEKHANLEVDD
ncbi:sulfotransferase family protein [Sandaracinus amylolyticus]|uniref:sulfotransferase family protein n=1 Tax=Sandaracinus amylolyticus TaxID=927083 RepID=UPI001F2B5219|nr:sulfotransferase family protein [Sandaracinus amylolyticus]UJR80840.1 TPR repeat:HAT (Half-A-TPR) repeat [Sandaracinus amylolyticus]